MANITKYKSKSSKGKVGRTIKGGLVLGTTAAAAGLGYWFTGRKVNRGGYPVEHGTLMPSPDYEEGDPSKIRAPSGRELPLNSIDAYYAAYRMAQDYTILLTRYTSLAERSLTPAQIRRLHEGFVRNGRYPVSEVCDENQRRVLIDMVTAGVFCGQSIRILAEVAQMANIREAFQPTRFKGKGDLQYIKFGSPLNPLALHPSETQWAHSVLSTNRTAGWRAIGAHIAREWLTAYLDVANAPGLRQGLEELTRITAGADNDEVTPYLVDQHPTNLTMGFPVVGAGIAIALIIVGIAVARTWPTTVRGAFSMAGVQVDYLETLRKEHEKALECAHDEDRPEAERERCRQDMIRITEAIREYDPGIAGVIRVGILGAVVIGGLIVFNQVRKVK